MGYYQVRYNSRVVIYNHRCFIRLTTGCMKLILFMSKIYQIIDSYCREKVFYANSDINPTLFETLNTRYLGMIQVKTKNTFLNPFPAQCAWILTSVNIMQASSILPYNNRKQLVLRQGLNPFNPRNLRSDGGDGKYICGYFSMEQRIFFFRKNEKLFDAI